LFYFFAQVNQQVSRRFSVTRLIRTLHWLSSQCTTARRSKNTTLYVYSSSLFALRYIMAILRNLHRDRSFLCSSVRSLACSAASTLGRSWVCSVLSVGRSVVHAFARTLVSLLFRLFNRLFLCLSLARWFVVYGLWRTEIFNFKFEERKCILGLPKTDRELTK